MDPLARKITVNIHETVAAKKASQEGTVSDRPQIPTDQPDEKRVNHEAKKVNSVVRFVFKLINKIGTSEPKQLRERRFEHEASGQSKRVYTDKTSDKYVYYVPIKGIFEKIFGTKKSEIQGEVKVAAEIKQQLSYLGFEGESHIATELVEVQGTDELEGRYVVRAPKAGDEKKRVDLDKLLHDEDSSLTMLDRLTFCEQLLIGVGNLHQAGYVHGDLKGDNIFHYRERQPNGEIKSILRIGDFGKTRKVEEGGSVLRTGNPRLADPEGRTSKKGEVFATALLLTHILEGEILHKEKSDMIIKPAQLKSDQKGENLRGIIKFIVTNAKCVQTDAKNVLVKIRLIAGAAKAILNIGRDEEKTSSEEAKNYIHALFLKLKEIKPPHEPKSLDQMEKLLIDMIDQRPPASTAAAQIQQILKLYRGGIDS